MSTQALHYLTITEVARMLRAREISPVALVEAHLERIERQDSRLHCFVHVSADAAREAARRAEAEIAAGNWRGPLHGVPIAHKDIVAVRGVPNTAHSHLLAGWKPNEDAAGYSRLARAGAISLGKLALHEFAFGTNAADAPFPAALNPWNTDFAPGASSSGSGAAVAAGLAMGATGTDTGGSIRSPAAVCGIVGMKPTFGRVSTRGVLSLAWSLDHLGPMTRTVRDNAIMLQAMAGFDHLDPTTEDHPVPEFSALIGRGLDGVRIGVLRRYMEEQEPHHPAVLAALNEALGVLRELGATLTEVDVPGLEHTQDIGRTLLVWEAWQYHRLTMSVWPEKYGASFLKRVSPAAHWRAERYREACERRDALKAQFARLRQGGIDVFVSAGRESPGPSMVELRADQMDLSARRMYNITGMPALVLPMGLDPNGLPMGLQLAGGWWEEDRVYQVAAAYEDAAGWPHRHPPGFP